MDLARSSSPFSMGDAERLWDFLLSDFSLQRLGDSLSDLERDLERDLRTSERERDLRDWERDFPVWERDLRAGDFERDFLLESDLLLLRDLDLEGTDLLVNVLSYYLCSALQKETQV